MLKRFFSAVLAALLPVAMLGIVPAAAQAPEAEIMPARGGASAIVSMTYDDALINTAEFNDAMFEKYGLKGTAILIVNNLTNNAATLQRFQRVMANGRIDAGSHSTTHDIITDETDAQTLTMEIVDSYNTLKQYFPELDILTFAPSNNTISAAGEAMVEETYYAQRKGNRGLNSLSPAEGEWYNLLTRGIGDVSTVAERNKWVDEAIAGGRWLLEMWHGIDEGGYHQQTKADAEQHYAYLAAKQDAGEIWVASFTEATKYIRERQASVVSAQQSGDTIEVSLTYPDSELPAEIFDYPLTVKVAVPDAWGVAMVEQNGKSAAVSTFVEGAQRYAYVDIVPNGGVAAVTDGGTSNLLSGIRVGDTLIRSFDANVTSYTVPMTRADLPITVEALPLDADAQITCEPADATLTQLPGSVSITVTDKNEQQKTYTVDFTYVPSDNAALSSVTINGSSLAAFQPDINEYTLILSQQTAQVQASAQDALASVAYFDGDSQTAQHDSITVSVPGRVRILVTAEDLTENEYIINVKSDNDDNEIIAEAFPYAVDERVSTEKWTAINFDVLDGRLVSGVVGAADPKNPSNAVGRCFNIKGAAQNQQLNSPYFGPTVDPVVIKGRIMRDALDTVSEADILIRGEGTNLVNICAFRKDGTIRIGNSGVLARWVSGEWIDYVLVVKPQSGTYDITAYLSGDGVRDSSGNALPAGGELVVGNTAGSIASADYTRAECRVLIRANVTSGEKNAIYHDDIRIYNPGAFKLSVPTNTVVEPAEGIVVTATHDIDSRTIDADAVIIRNAQQRQVQATDAYARGNKLYVSLPTTMLNGTYTLSLAASAKDVVGKIAVNSVTFSVDNTTGSPDLSLYPGISCRFSGDALMLQSEEQKDVIAYMAVYRTVNASRRLHSIERLDVSLQAGVEKLVPLSLPSTSAGEEIALYVWEKQTIKPIIETLWL